MPPSKRVERTTLAILAGGEGSRMGRAKALLQIQDVPILCWMMQRIAWPGPTLLVTAPGREHPPGAQMLDREVTDLVSGQGPMRGILTALESIETQAAIVLPVDMPLMGTEPLQWLAEQPFEIGVMLRRNRELEPMPLLIRPAARPLLEQLISQGRRSVAQLSSVAGFSVCDAPPTWHDRVWTNLNYPADLPLRLDEDR